MLEEVALNSTAFPVNPTPFARRLVRLLEGSPDKINDWRVRSCLLVLLQQSWGQVGTLDVAEECRQVFAECETEDEIATYRDEISPMVGDEPGGHQRFEATYEQLLRILGDPETFDSVGLEPEKVRCTWRVHIEGLETEDSFLVVYDWKTGKDPTYNTEWTARCDPVVWEWLTNELRITPSGRLP